MILTAEEILFRPSGGDIMVGSIGLTPKQQQELDFLQAKPKRTDKQELTLNELIEKSQQKELSTTCKRYLLKMARQIKYNRYTQITNKYLEKGLKCEEDGITLYSIYKKVFYKKNKDRIKNKWFDGEPDIIHFDGTKDIKCSWSLDTFPNPLVDPIDPSYEFQGDCYMDLTGLDRHTIAYTLVNAPVSLIISAKNNLFYTMGQPDDSNEEYMIGKRQIERNMIFDMTAFKTENPNYDLDTTDWVYDIPKEERVVEYHIERNESRLEAIKERITLCREFLNELFSKATL